MDEASIGRIIDLAYAASAGETGWAEPVLAIQDALGAASSVLFTHAGPGAAPRPLHVNLDPAAMGAYAAHYHRHDPWLLEAHPSGLQDLPPLSAVLGQSLVDPEALRRTEFYNDFARPIGVEWMTGSVGRLGPAGSFQAAFHRPAGRPAFDDAALRLLGAVLPHLRRALQLGERLGPAGPGRAAPDLATPELATPELAALALDALPDPVLVVDADLGLHHANAAALRLCGPGAALRLVRDGARPGAPLGLRLPAPADSARLAALVQGVALGGGAGGTLRLLAPPDGPAPGPAHGLVLLVSPLPRRLFPEAAQAGAPGLRPGFAPGLRPGFVPGLRPGLALLQARRLERVPPAVPFLQELFGLTQAEAEVAAGLAGGMRAGALAARRGVTLPTIRAQIRRVLEKTRTLNLRELEALLASLPPAP